MWSSKYPLAKWLFLVSSILLLLVVFRVQLGTFLLYSIVSSLVFGGGLLAAKTQNPRRALFLSSALMLALVAIVWVLKDNVFSVFFPKFSFSLPSSIGLSYLLLRLISFILDIRWKRVKAPSLAEFHLYNFYFATFVSGPIEKYADFIASVEKSGEYGWTQRIELGVPRIVKGLVKVYVLAPHLYDYTFLSKPAGTMAQLAVSLCLYTIYEFLDFSGYSDLVIGTSWLLGIRLTENFDRPYLAASPKEMWLRWHRSLAIFFRDYVYSPCLKMGLRHFKIADPRNRQWMLSSLAFFAVFMLCGLWHGRTLGGLLFGFWFFLVLSLNSAFDIYLKPFLSRRLVHDGLLSRLATFVGWLAAILTLVIGNGLIYFNVPAYLKFIAH